MRGGCGDTSKIYNFITRLGIPKRTISTVFQLAIEQFISCSSKDQCKKKNKKKIDVGLSTLIIPHSQPEARVSVLSSNRDNVILVDMAGYLL
jgi:hypothetical protein